MGIVTYLRISTECMLDPSNRICLVRLRSREKAVRLRPISSWTEACKSVRLSRVAMVGVKIPEREDMLLKIVHFSLKCGNQLGSHPRVSRNSCSVLPCRERTAPSMAPSWLLISCCSLLVRSRLASTVRPSLSKLFLWSSKEIIRN